MIRNIIFDVGKVLVSYEPDEYMKSLGFGDEVRAAINAAMFENKLWDDYDQGLDTPEGFLNKFIAGAPEYERQIRQVYDTLGGCIELLPYAMDWIMELRSKGYKVYILSNYSEHTFAKTKEKLKFLSVVDGALFSYTCKILKPSPEIYLRLMEEYRLKPAECVFIDDRQVNVEGAQRLGIHGILFESYEIVHAQLEKILHGGIMFP